MKTIKGTLHAVFSKIATKDWIANTLPGLPIGAVTVGLEMRLFQLSLTDMSTIRALYVPIVNIALILGLWGKAVDLLEREMNVRNKGFLAKLIADGLGNNLFRLPIYGACALLVGIEPAKVGLMCWYYFVMNNVTGWINVRFRDWLKPRFKFFNGIS